MKKIAFPFLTILLLSSAAVAQTDLPPARSATIFKNGRSVVQRFGAVPVTDRQFSTTRLPNALFGTFWASAPNDGLSGVMSRVDSVADTPKDPFIKNNFEGLIGKNVEFILFSASQIEPAQIVAGTIEGVYASEYTSNRFFVVKKKNGEWTQFNQAHVLRMNFMEKPEYQLIPAPKKAVPRLTFLFKQPAARQELGLSYLTTDIGWTPTYQLELNGKKAGKLALRAEIINDAEDLGDAELRLAVGVPNFAYATRRSGIVDLSADVFDYLRHSDRDYSGSLYMANQMLVPAFDPETYEERMVPAGNAGGFVGSQAEDYYYYTLRPGAFPKNSRYHLDVFDADIEATHYYESQILQATPGNFNQYTPTRKPDQDPFFDVYHFIEFKNNTTFPWTTGAVNIVSTGSDGARQPVSQDMLPYTPTGGKCKVRIAQTPEIKVSHVEGDILREADAREFFNRHYDRVTLEGQVSVVNYKSETVTLRIRRVIEGQPIKSDYTWTTRQEAATLRVNSQHIVEWELTLKPGEEKQWKYAYSVYVDL